MHGRTYKQAFTGKADLTGIYELKQHLNIPVICNGDMLSYDDGVAKIIHPMNRTRHREERSDPVVSETWIATSSLTDTE